MSEQQFTEEQIAAYLDGLSDQDIDQLFLAASEIDDAKRQEPLLFFGPHEGQRGFNNSNKKLLFGFGGNGSGKTYMGCKRTVCFAQGYDPSGSSPNVKYRPAPRKGFFGADSLSKAWAMMYQTLIPMLPRGYLVKPDHKNNLLHFKDGGSLNLLSYSSGVEAWSSYEFDYGQFDEQPPYGIYLEGCSRVARTGGHIWCGMTPERTREPWAFREIVLNERNDPEVEYYTMDTRDNTFLSNEAQERFRKQYEGTAQEASKLRGEFALLSGLIHDQFSDEMNVIQPFEITKGFLREFQFCRVIDAHFANPCVCNWFMYKKRPDPVAYLIKELVLQTHIKTFGQHVLAMSEGLPIKFTILDTPEARSDHLMGTNIQTELAKIGIPTVESYEYRNLYTGIERTNRYLELGKFFVFNTCHYSITTLKSYMWDTWANIDIEKNKKEKPRQSDDHAVRNIHYFFMTMPSLESDLGNEIFRESGKGQLSYMNDGFMAGRY